MSIKKYTHAQDILDKIINFYNLKGYPALADFLGVNYQTIMAWKKRGRIADYAPFMDKCTGIRLSWLETGEGEMFDKKHQPPPLVREAAGEGYGEINPLDAAFLRDWKALSEVEQMRFWTLLKEAIQKDKERYPK